MTTNFLDNLPKSLKSIRNEITKTLLPSIHLESVANSKLELWSSKFGGVPYWEKTCQDEFPSDERGNWMILLAQINFAECNSDGFLADYPKSGILQFFISPELNTVFGSLKSENEEEKIPNFYLKYWDNPKEEEKFLENSDNFEEIFNGLDNDESIDFNSPFDYQNGRKVFRKGSGLVFQRFMEPVNMSDNNFDELVPKCVKVWKDSYKEYTNDFESNNKICGYPFFWQDDYRKKDEKRNLLLQFKNSDGAIIKFFINKKDLLQLNFDDIFYDVEI